MRHRVVGARRWAKQVGQGLCVLALCVCSRTHSYGQLIYRENFEGNDSGYTLFDPGYEPQTPENGWSPGIWGLNTLGPQIGLTQNAPANRAAILWNHDPAVTAADFTAEALDVWVSLTDWSMGVTTPAARANKRIAIVPGYQNEAVNAVREKLVAAGYKDLLISETGADYTGLDASNTDLIIHSSEQAGAVFVSTPVPVISFSAPDHDDTAIAGLGEVLQFADPVSLTVPQAYRNHPALGTAGADGVIQWTNNGVPLQGIGIPHNGGKAIAQVENPNTGDLNSAIFIVDKGSPLLGAFNPDPEGDHYIVGSALNKFGSAAERLLELDPINVSGKNDVKLRVALAGVTTDFENGDYVRIEVDPDGNGPKGTEIIEEFWGVNDAASPCNKGLSNGDVAGEQGTICLTPDFKDYTFPVPAGATNMVVRFAALTTWGNEIFAIDDVRVFSGNLLVGDFNGNGSLDAGDLDLISVGQATNDRTYDLNGSGNTDYADRQFWVSELKKTWVGDANLDGEFNSGDFVSVFGAGLFETGNPANWSQGDWNGDQQFTTSDFVSAFQDGGYELGVKASVAAVPEPATGGLLAAVTAGLLLWRRRR